MKSSSFLWATVLEKSDLKLHAKCVQWLKNENVAKNQNCFKIKNAEEDEVNIKVLDLDHLQIMLNNHNN